MLKGAACNQYSHLGTQTVLHLLHQSLKFASGNFYSPVTTAPLNEPNTQFSTPN